jgi:type VI secretion system secreted protein VgrG
MAIATTLGDDAVLLESFSYTEDFSRPYRLTAVVTAPKPADLTIEDAIGKVASIRIQRKDKQTRYLGGIVARISQDARVKEKPRYELTIVPKLWLLSRSADCRVFQKMSVPDIIKKVFSNRGIADALVSELKGSYDPRDFVVQYRETDFNFISRLMEVEGIYYYHRHDKNGKHQMVLADDTACHQPLDGYKELPFRLPGVEVAPDRVFDWHCEAEIQAERIALAAFDFKAPNVKPKETKSLDYQRTCPTEIFDYPVEFHLPDEVKRHARLRSEELAAGATIYLGRTDCRGVCCGGKFTLTDPQGQLLTSHRKEYLVVGVSCQGTVQEYHSGGGGGASEEFACSFRCVDAKKVFRPARTTPKPVVAGSQTAIVVGPKGEEIYTDKYGRVKLQFHWDRESKADENSSCWVRVSQAWAGTNWGAITIPRIGQEVIVDFLEGDPDRPIVTGRVYNDLAKPPYKLPDNQTRTTLKSLSSKGGGGFNEFRFEDKKGSEEVFIHAEKDFVGYVKNDSTEWIKRDLHFTIDRDRFEKVKHDAHKAVDNDEFQKIGKDLHITVGGKAAVDIGGGLSLKITGNDAAEISSDLWRKVTGNVGIKAAGVTIEATSGITLKCGGNSVVIDSSGVTVKGSMVVIDGGMTNINSGPGSPPVPATPASLVAPTAPKDPNTPEEGEAGQKDQAPEAGEDEKDATMDNGTVYFSPASAGKDPEKPAHFIEIELKDEQGHPIPGESYEIVLPDGSTAATGTLDEKGFARVDGIDPGQCEVKFPDMNDDDWDHS